MDKNLNKTEKHIKIEELAPKVSIQIITKNRANLLPLAIESALNQTYKNLEVIIVDNNSTDKTEELMKKYVALDNRIKYFRVIEHLNITEARNRALSKSNGKYIAVLDSDDFWLSQDKIEKQIDFMEKNTDHGLIGNFSIIVNSNNQKIGEIKNETDWVKIKEKFLLKNQIVHSSSLIRKNVLDEIGGYVSKYEIWEDYATFLKIGKQYKIANLPEIMTAYKKHAGNISNFSKIKNLFILARIIFDNKRFYPKFFTAMFLVVLRIVATLFKKY
jgi:glycosyltransferase involved in cell wall biosynthesis